MYQDFLIDQNLNIEAYVLKATLAFENDDIIQKLDKQLGYKPINLLKVIKGEKNHSDKSSVNANTCAGMKSDPSCQSLINK